MHAHRFPTLTQEAHPTCRPVLNGCCSITNRSVSIPFLYSSISHFTSRLTEWECKPHTIDSAHTDGSAKRIELRTRKLKIDRWLLVHDHFDVKREICQRAQFFNFHFDCYARTHTHTARFMEHWKPGPANWFCYSAPTGAYTSNEDSCAIEWRWDEKRKANKQARKIMCLWMIEKFCMPYTHTLARIKCLHQNLLWTKTVMNCSFQPTPNSLSSKRTAALNRRNCMLFMWLL